MNAIVKIDRLIEKASSHVSAEALRLLFIEVESVLGTYFKDDEGLVDRFDIIENQYTVTLFINQGEGIDASEIKVFLEGLRDRKEEEASSRAENGFGMDALLSTLRKTIESFVLMDPTFDEAKSRTIPAHVRNFVIDRDKGTCQLCGNKVNNENTQLDHIYPYALGGANNELNMMVTCAKCNLDKGAKTSYLKTAIGRKKPQENINRFLDKTLLATNFKEWLIKESKKDRKASTDSPPR